LRFWEEYICTPSLTALHIEAEVVRWVYNVGPDKPSTTSRTDTLETATHQSSGFFSPQSDRFEASSTPAPMVPKEPINLFEATSLNIVLTVFAANVDVQVDDKMTGELLRSTLKKPPSRLRYELIFVSATVVQCVLNIGSYFCSDGEGRIRLKRQGGGGCGICYREGVSTPSG
jgi:hypothetical protein